MCLCSQQYGACFDNIHPIELIFEPEITAKHVKLTASTKQSYAVLSLELFGFPNGRLFIDVLEWSNLSLFIMFMGNNIIFPKYPEHHERADRVFRV